MRTSKPKFNGKVITGTILYEGPSLLDGAPIVAIATGLDKASANSKTGDMVQTWILAAGDLSPQAAVDAGADSSVCGDCPLKGAACYVVTWRAPRSVYECYKRGNYPRGRYDLLQGRKVRVGSYGDPAAVPASVWEQAVAGAVTYTGYTHQWRRTQATRAFTMASVDTLEQREKARALGFRTFRVGALETLQAGEILCPASEEAGRKVTCADCGLCKGAGKAKDIMIPAHGPGAKVAAQKVASLGGSV